MNPFHILRPSTIRTCCKRSFSAARSIQQNERSRNSAAALLELAAASDRRVPSSSQIPVSHRASRNAPPIEPSNTSRNHYADPSTAPRSTQSNPFSNASPTSNFASSSQLPQFSAKDSFRFAETLAESHSEFRRMPPSSLTSSDNRSSDFAISETSAQLQSHITRSELEQQMHRRWRRGDVYAPHDLSSVEMSKWKAKRGTPRRDVFDELGIDPRNEYKNFALLGEFMTETGRIKHSNATGLRPRNQRRLAKAIRRAIGIGIMPSVHKHPELLGRRR